MLTVRDLMSHPAQAVHAHAPACDVHCKLLEGRFRHLPVVDDHGAVVGIVTDGDLARITGGALGERRHELLTNRLVCHVMTTPVETIGPDATAVEAADTMLESQHGCLPVIEEGRLVGMLTEFDFVRYVAATSGDHG